MKASEVIEACMNLFGKDGKGWNNHSLYDWDRGRETRCLLGGLRKVSRKAESETSRYAPKMEHRAVQIVHGLVGQIPNFNDKIDSDDYREYIKPVLCKALQIALEEEGKE